jgi:hypothetical protein
MVDSPTLNMTSTTDLALPCLHFVIRQGEVQDVPADPEAAACMVARVDIREVPAPQSETTREPPPACR